MTRVQWDIRTHTLPPPSLHDNPTHTLPPCTMIPHTHTLLPPPLQESKRNTIKDFVAVAGPMGVTHFLILTATEKSGYMKVAKTPRVRVWEGGEGGEGGGQGGGLVRLEEREWQRTPG